MKPSFQCDGSSESTSQAWLEAVQDDPGQIAKAYVERIEGSSVKNLWRVYNLLEAQGRFRIEMSNGTDKPLKLLHLAKPDPNAPLVGLSTHELAKLELNTQGLSQQQINNRMRKQGMTAYEALTTERKSPGPTKGKKYKPRAIDPFSDISFLRAAYYDRRNVSSQNSQKLVVKNTKDSCQNSKVSCQKGRVDN